MANLSDRLLDLLGRSRPLDDDEVAAVLGVNRVYVNQTARRLQAAGQLVRERGPTGKIANRLPDAGTGVHSPMPIPLVVAARPGLLSEDDVKRGVKEYLEARGYRVQVAWGRDRGIDIDARGPAGRLVIEAKGEVASNPQQVNYFLGALGELVQRMSDAEARYGLALPDNRQYRGLVSRLPGPAWDRLHLFVLFVRRSEEGAFAVEARHM
jgi:hypothetical protein